VDFPLELNRIVQNEAPCKFRFSFNGKIIRSQKPLIRADNFFIIHLFYFRTNSFFAYEFDGGHKEIHQGAQGTIYGGQSVAFGRGGEAVITHEVSDAGVVFLFDETVVVFTVRPRARELDMFVVAPFEHGGIDKLGAVVAVYAHEGERDGGFNVQQGLENPFVGFVERGTQFNPS